MTDHGILVDVQLLRCHFKLPPLLFALDVDNTSGSECRYGDAYIMTVRKPSPPIHPISRLAPSDNGGALVAREMWARGFPAQICQLLPRFDLIGLIF